MKEKGQLVPLSEVWLVDLDSGQVTSLMPFVDEFGLFGYLFYV